MTNGHAIGSALLVLAAVCVAWGFYESVVGPWLFKRAYYANRQRAKALRKEGEALRDKEITWADWKMDLPGPEDGLDG